MLTFHEIGLCDNLVFERLHRRNDRVNIVAIAVAIAIAVFAASCARMKPKLIFSIVVFVKFFIVDFADTRDGFQVIFEFFINKLHEILSRHLILHVEFRLHFIQKRFFDSIGSFLTRESTYDRTPAAPDAANFTCLCHEISRCLHRQRNTIPIHITKIITVAAWNHIRYTRITHPSPILSFVIQKSCFGRSDVVIFTRKSLSRGCRHHWFDILFFFDNRIIPVANWTQTRSHHNRLRFFFGLFIRHLLLFDEFVH